MKTIKNKKLSLISIIVLLIITITLISLSIIKAEANDNVTDLVGAAAGQPEENVIQPYAFKSTPYPKITQFPINAGVFNSDVHFFCAQRGVPYGGQYRNTQVGDGTYHRGNTATGYVVSGYSDKMDGDVPSGVDFYIDKSGNFQKPSSISYYSYKESTETPTDYVFTNWWYTSKDLKFDCEGTDEEAGLAFLLACFISGEGNNNYIRGTYREDPMQHAIWASFINTGDKTSNPLQKAQEAYVKYHKDSDNPNVNTKPDEHVGTTISADGSTYTVGPFFMYDYVEAEDYESQKVDTQPASSYDDIDLNIDPDEVVAETMAGGTVLSENVTLQENFGSSHLGTIIKAEAVVSNGSSETRIPISIPEGGTNYNINLSASDINGYDELKDIIFTYQRVHASANGTKYEGRQYKLKFSQESSAKSECTYACTDHTPSYASHSSGYTYGGSQTCYYYWSCNSSGAPKESSHDCPQNHWHSGCDCGGRYCSNGGSHYWYTDHSGCDHGAEEPVYNCDDIYYSCDDCTPICDADHDCGSYCNCPGHSDSHTSIFKCGHQHEACEKFDWQFDGEFGDYAQDGFAGAGSLVNEIIEYKIKVEVPLKTKMTIYKYITNVEHALPGGTNDLTVPDRSGMTAAEKLADSVKVERGDIVTYKVVIKNDSRFPTAVQVEDFLPAEYTNLEITPSGYIKYTGKSGGSSSANWIEVDAHSETEFTIKLRPDAKTGTHENRVEFITTNDKTPHMKYVEWGYTATHGTHTYGDIVNVDRSREKDSDYYTIKEYDVTIDKYITNVKHATNGVSTFSGTSRKKQEESSKKSNPVYAEFGDIVTYNIDIYNTNEEYMTGSYKDREASPFWEPDICYIDVVDTLPKKYSNLEVTTTDGSGNVSIGTGSFTITNVKVPAGGKVTVTVKLVVEEVTRNTLEENNAVMDGEVRNVNNKEVINHSTRTDTSDWYRINDYNISIDKFISNYTSDMTEFNNNRGFTNNESTTLADRFAMTEQEKANAPVQAEKTDRIEYTIRVKNDSVGSGLKRATQVRPTVVKDAMDPGLTVVADGVTGVMYKADGTVKHEGFTFGVTNSGNTYFFTLADKLGEDYLILDPGEWIDYKVIVEVTQSNMYLYSLKNTVSYDTLTNINHVTEDSEKQRVVTTENISGHRESSEYVKLKDLVIAGRVWLDTDKDGFMGIGKNGIIQTGTSAIRVEENPTTRVDETKEYAMEGIDVHLYKKDGSLVRSTETDSSGFFTFGRDESLVYYAGSYTASGAGVTESAQRIDKATNKDENKNYTSSSELIEYYIEYEYDGLVYRSTPVYSDDTHINNNGSYQDDYIIDSNAAEFTAVRQDYNKQHELIGYNTAYGGDEPGSLPEPSILEFEKTDHISYIKENHEREMTARSFITLSNQTTKYLWLKKDATSTETEYLKYINLGLELRDQFDLRLSKDLISAEVDINGYDMRYDYAQMPNGELYDRAEIYKLYYYKSDYAYRYTMYSNQEVRDAKGEDSELKITLNYRIKVYNESPDQTYSKINEIIDFNSKSMTIQSAKYVSEFNADGTAKTTKDMVIKSSPTYFRATTENTDPGYTFDGYETNYLTWDGDIPVIGQGEDITIDLVYTVDRLCDLETDKDHTVDANRALLIKDPYEIKSNVAQIFAYSTYEDRAATIPKGLVDCDSNAGNINQECVKLNDNDADNTQVEQFEDNAFRVRVQMLEKTDERQVTGFVFEDTRSEKVTDFNQFVGNGIYDDGAGILNAEDKKHPHIGDMFKKYGLTTDDKQDLDKDTKLDGMTVELVQIVTVDGKQYEETIDPLSTTKENIIVRTQTANGEYKLSSFIPGVYIVRFRYGDMYAKTGDMTYNSLLHNGQDYRSTTYILKDSSGNILESDNGAATPEAKKAYNTEKYMKLSDADNRVSDARDNELRRIEVMAYSETMTNEKAEEMKYTNYAAKDTDGKVIAGTNPAVTPELQRFADITNAFADTITIELDVEQREHTEEISTNNYTEENLTFVGNRADVNLELPNIDFGVSFRPENYLELIKQIKSIKLTTSAGEVLVEAYYDIDGNLETAKSKGIENVQSIDNKLIVNTLTAETQGFRYINVDEDVLQGATISVEYYMFVDNIGEVDTVDKFLIENGYSTGILAEFNKAENRDVIKSNGGANENYIRMKELIQKTFSEIYEHGFLVGDVYYNGTSSDMVDVVVVPIKPSKILDLIDNDATFSVQNNSTTGKFWTVTDEEELKEKGLVDERRLFNSSNYKDYEGRYYTTFKTDTATSENVYSKNNLAINIPSEGENPTFVKEIYPEYYATDDGAIVEPEDFKEAMSSYIVIQVDAVLAGDTATEDMVYDNIAEIVEYISPVGRRTNFASTIGNIEVNGTTSAYQAAQIEVDTDGTEVIRLTPPTGMMETELFISGNRNTIHILIIAVAAIVLIYIIRFNLKGRIGKSKFYK